MKYLNPTTWELIFFSFASLLTYLSNWYFEGSETFLRDFIYVDDVVSVNNFFFENEKIRGIFNCGTGHAESFLEIAKAL